MSAIGTKQAFSIALQMSAFGAKATFNAGTMVLRMTWPWALVTMSRSSVATFLFRDSSLGFTDALVKDLRERLEPFKTRTHH